VKNQLRKIKPNVKKTIEKNQGKCEKNQLRKIESNVKKNKANVKNH